MTMFILSAAALLMTLPCIVVWAGDAKRRPAREQP
jgi:hypothetical protein